MDPTCFDCLAVALASRLTRRTDVQKVVSGRRQTLRALGGLLGTALGIIPVSDRTGAEAGHVCCSIRSKHDGTVLSGCFKHYGDECASIPEGYRLICKEPVHSCGDCSKTVCPNTKKG